MWSAIIIAFVTLLQTITQAADQQSHTVPTYYLSDIGRGDTLQLNNTLSGEIISHRGFDGTTEYGRNIDSTVTISNLTSQYVLRVVFEFFDIYYNSKYPNCKSDWLEFGGISGLGWRVKLCDYSVYRPRTNTTYRYSVVGSSVSFRFRTNGGKTYGDGFKFSFSLIEPATSQPQSYATEQQGTTPQTYNDETEKGDWNSKEEKLIIGGVTGGLIFIILLLIVALIFVTYRHYCSQYSLQMKNQPKKTKNIKQYPYRNNPNKVVKTAPLPDLPSDGAGQIYEPIPDEYSQARPDEYSQAKPVSYTKSPAQRCQQALSVYIDPATQSSLMSADRPISDTEMYADSVCLSDNY